MSAQRLHRYVNEFAGRQNIREQNTIDQMAFIVRNLVGKIEVSGFAVLSILIISDELTLIAASVILQ